MEVKEWRKIYHANTNQKKGGVALLTSDKMDHRTRKIIKNKERALHNDKGGQFSKKT